MGVGNGLLKKNGSLVKFLEIFFFFFLGNVELWLLLLLYKMFFNIVIMVVGVGVLGLFYVFK